MRVAVYFAIAIAMAYASFPPSQDGWYPDPQPGSPQDESRLYRASNYAVGAENPTIHKIELLVNGHPVFTINVHASNLMEEAKSLLVAKGFYHFSTNF